MQIGGLAIPDAIAETESGAPAAFFFSFLTAMHNASDWLIDYVGYKFNPVGRKPLKTVKKFFHWNLFDPLAVKQVEKCISAGQSFG